MDDIEIAELPLLHCCDVEVHQVQGYRLLCMRDEDGQTHCFRMSLDMALRAQDALAGATGSVEIVLAVEALH